MPSDKKKPRWTFQVIEHLDAECEPGPSREALLRVLSAADEFIGSLSTWIDPIYVGYGKAKEEQHRQYDCDPDALRELREAIETARARQVENVGIAQSPKG